MRRGKSVGLNGLNTYVANEEAMLKMGFTLVSSPAFNSVTLWHHYVTHICIIYA